MPIAFLVTCTLLVGGRRKVLCEHGPCPYGAFAVGRPGTRAMTQTQTSTQHDARQDPFRWSQIDTAQVFADFWDPYNPPSSQRHYAQEHGIPRSTLGDWLRRPDPAGVAKEVVLFF